MNKSRRIQDVVCLFMRISLTQLLLVTVFASLVSAAEIKGQEVLERRISLDVSERDVSDVLKEIENQALVTFSYRIKTIKNSGKVTLQIKDAPLGTVLEQMFGEAVIFQVRNNEILLKPRIDEILVNSSADPQNAVIEVNGTVLDETDQSLPGVNVVEKGTTNGTTTDVNGAFSLQVQDEKSILVFSFIGYAMQEVVVGSQTKFRINLAQDIRELDEVVVVGYGTVKKSDLTGSVSTIKAEELLDRPTVNIGQALSGKLPGVEIFNNSGRPDGRIKIRIRGNSSITASNEPLYVIDGVIGVADINLINPNNIESLQVLKDASATAIYGARGANGVILVTTKRGLDSDKGIIAYDGYTSFSVMAKKQNIEFLNANEWWQVYNTGFDNIEKYDPIGYAQGKFKRALPEDLPKLFNSAGNPIYDTDWEDEAYRTAISQNHQLSFRGGNDKTTHSIYLGYLRQEALMDKNYLERFNGQFNMDSQLRSWLKVGGNVSLNYNTGNDLYDNYRLKRLTQEALPFIPVKYPDGSWGSNRDFPGAVQDTPSRYLEEMIDQTTNTQFISDFYADFKITKDLNFKSTFAVDNRNQKNNYYTGKNLIQFGGKNNGGIATIRTQNQIYWQNENYLNWNKQVSQNSKLDLMLGLSWQQRSAELLGTEHRNFIDDFYQWHNLGSGTVNQPSSSSDWKWSLNSYFARANYNLYNKYLFTATGRYDGSSKFGKNNRYAFFPSVAFAWVMSEENVLKNSNFVDFLKIRASIGETGNQEIANYAYSQNLGSGNVIFRDAFYSALYRSSFGNPDLKWETTLQFDAGFDITFLKGSMDMTFDYYRKITTDLLLNAPIPYTSGLNSVMQNIGSVKNEGFEIALNTDNLNRGDFNWTSSFSFATNKNKILNLGENDEDIFPTRHATGDMQILRVGEPVGAFWGLTRLGTWSTDEVDEAAAYNRLPGDLKYADINNDGKIDENDNSVIGGSLPDWTMGISNSFRYGSFNLSFDIRVVNGIDVMNAGTHTREDRSGVANGSITQLNAWTPENQNTMVAELRYMKTYYDSYPDTHWLQDGSFVRLQNLLISYNFNSSFLNRIKLQKVRVYASGQNLILLTKYNGYDPEVSTHASEFGQGIDDFGEPRARTYTIGLNLNF